MNDLIAFPEFVEKTQRWLKSRNAVSAHAAAQEHACRGAQRRQFLFRTKLYHIDGRAKIHSIQPSAASRFAMGVSVGGYVVNFARNPVVDRDSGESHYP